MKKLLIKQLLYEIMLILIIVFIVYFRFVVETGYGLDQSYPYAKFMAYEIFGHLIYIDMPLIILFGLLLGKYISISDYEGDPLALAVFHLVSGLLVGTVSLLISLRLLYISAVLIWDDYGRYPLLILAAANISAAWRYIRLRKKRKLN